MGLDETRPKIDSATSNETVVRRAHVRIVVGRPALQCRSFDGSGLTIGRVSEVTACDESHLALDDQWVSRRHVRVYATGGPWQLSDLRGRNRAFVDGKQVPEGGNTPLHDGSLIRIGDSLLVFRLGAAPSNIDDKAEHPRFPGCAPSAIAVRQRLRQLTRTTGPVLVLGETGTGKERVARSFAVTDQPFVPQNCAELSRALARSELFGHTKGAFTGAVAKTGLVEVAEHGVLFLDELGELPIEVQAELLRFLEDGCFRPVGSTELRHSSARVVAATNLDLDAAVRAGKFRRDLLARLRASNLPITLPSLHARREDILPWAEAFWSELHAGYDCSRISLGTRTTTWNAGTAECLLLFQWSGNLRDLRGLVHNVAASGLDLSIRPEHLPNEIRDYRRALRGNTDVVPEVTTPTVAQVPPSGLTRENIEAALSATSGSVRATATRLGIDRRKLYRLREKLGIDLDGYRGES